MGLGENWVANSDDGGGIASKILRKLFLAGFPHLNLQAILPLPLRLVHRWS